jgi:hypothetical protein
MTDTEPRAFTADEVRKDFLDQLRHLVFYWDTQVDRQTQRERMEGLVFSILNIFDGTAGGMCAMDISLSPHPDDAEYQRENGDNWFEEGMVINKSAMMHEEWYA